MSLIDVLLFITTFVLLFVLVSSKYSNKRIVLTGVIVTNLFFLLHLIFGLIRWQLLPVYIIVPLVSILLILREYRDIKIKPILGKILSIMMFTGFVLSVISVASFPIYELPNPTGDYMIGTKSFVIEDTEREELYASREYRRFMIQMWYPTDSVEGLEQAVWLEGGMPLATSLAKDNYLPGFALRHSTHVLSNSYYDALVSGDLSEYPVVVISHGWRGFRTLHTDFAEELASQGYFVVSIDHTYGSVATVFAEDDVAYLNLDALEYRETNPNFLEDANALVNTYSGDILKTLDYLEELNQEFGSIFYTRLDLDKIGVIGHSTGGGAAVDAALKDERVTAVMGLDPWVEPIGHDALVNGLDIPALYLRSEAWEVGLNNAYLYNLYNNSSDTNMYQINGTTHFDFAMVYMYSPLTKYIGFTGSVDSAHLTSILRGSMTDFFDEHLKNMQVDDNLDNLEELVAIP